MEEHSDFKLIDFLILIGYFVFILGLGIWSSRKGENDSLRGFFLAGRNMNWFLVGCGLFASNFGSTHFIGLTGSGAKDGIGIAGFELNTMFVLLLLGWLFVPVYLAGQVYTMPEYLRKRFGGQRIQIYLTILSLILSIFIRTSADLYAGVTYIEKVMSWSMYPAILSLLAVAGVFTILGGLVAVMVTDMVQTILIIAGASLMAILTLNEVGGLGSIYEKFALVVPSNESLIGFNVKNESCSKPTEYYSHLIRPANDPQFPWTGMTIGLTISAVWGWCSDQVLVQRTLCAKNVSHAKAGCILAGYLKILPLFLFVFPGMAARIIFPDEMTCSAPEACQELCGSPYGCQDTAYPLLVKKLAPSGVKGFIMSVILSAVMSSLTSVFNSSSTLFTIDIWARIRKNASEFELIIVGKVFIVVMVAISVAWMPVIKLAQGSQLFHYTQSVISYLAPPICAVYVLAIFWHRVNEKGAFWGLMSGLFIGVIRFVLDFTYSPPTCESGSLDDRPLLLSRVHYLHFGCILFILVSLVTIVISFMGEPIPAIKYQRLTFWTRNSLDVKVNVIELKPLDKGSSEENLKMGLEKGENASKRPSIQQSKIKQITYCLCGFGSKLTSEKEPKIVNEEDLVKMSVQLLHEPKTWKILCNINGVVLLMVSIFIWVYYA